MLVGVTARHAAAQPPPTVGSGVVEGRVVDAATGEPLPGAQVLVTGSAAETSTDRDGRFRLSAVPAGDRTVVVTYLGRQDATVEARVVAGATQRLDIQMKMVAFEESVSVPGQLILDAQERALNQQKTAPNITNVVSADQIGSFPDRNAAETTQRIPGVSITKDQGEGRYVNIRGTEPRLNSMMIDGQRIPSPDPLIRQVAVDVVPSELLQSIEVSKALTPDMDADSIGGSVNLVMKQAPEKLRLFGAVGGGYNELSRTYKQNNYSFTPAGGSTAARRALIGSGERLGDEPRQSGHGGRLHADADAERAESALVPGQSPSHRVHRRVRLQARARLQPSPFARVFNRFIDDHENRQRVRFAVANRRIDHELRDRTHIERITSLGLTGHASSDGSATVDYQLLGAYSDQFDPLTMTTMFRHTNVNFAPNVIGDVDRPEQRPGQPAERGARELQLPVAASRDQLREGSRHGRRGQRAHCRSRPRTRRRRF